MLRRCTVSDTSPSPNSSSLLPDPHPFFPTGSFGSRATGDKSCRFFPKWSPHQLIIATSTVSAHQVLRLPPNSSFGLSKHHSPAFPCFLLAPVCCGNFPLSPSLKSNPLAAHCQVDGKTLPFLTFVMAHSSWYLTIAFIHCFYRVYLP